MKKEDEPLEFRDLTFKEQELIHLYRNNSIFRTRTEEIIYKKLGGRSPDKKAKQSRKENKNEPE